MAINTNKFMNRLFRRINGLVWDVVSGNIGLQTENGIYTVSFDENSTPTVNVNPIDGLGLALPAFATQTAFADIIQGDLVVGDQGIIGWVVDKTEAALKVIEHNGFSKTYTPPKVAILGGSGVLVVRNLMSLTGGAAGATNFASSLLPLLMLGGGDDKLEKLLPLLLMTSQAAPAAAGAAAPAANPMASLLPLMLMGGLGGDGKKGDLDPMMLLALSGGLGGGAGGMNPMVMMALMGKGDLFGGSDVKPTPLAPTTRGGIPTLQRL